MFLLLLPLRRRSRDVLVARYNGRSTRHCEHLPASLRAPSRVIASEAKQSPIIHVIAGPARNLLCEGIAACAAMTEDGGSQ
jgi:hypothetical protein